MRFYKKNVDGFEMILTPDDGGIGRVLLASNTPGENYQYARECGFMQLMNETIKPGMTCIDLGSNVGYATLIMLRNSGEEGYVYAIEPDNHNLNFLVENIKINNYLSDKKCQIFKCLISDKDSNIPFWIARHPNLNSVNKTKHSVRSEIIDCFRLDTFLKDKRYPNFIKMDIEGHEVAVFNGAHDYFKDNRGTTHILLEIHPSEYNKDNDFEECMRKYFDIGFKCSAVISTPTPRPALFKKENLKLDKSFFSDGFERGLYRDVPSEIAIRIACKEYEEPWRGGVSKKIARSIMLSRIE